MLLPTSIRKFAKKPDDIAPVRVRYANKLPEGVALDTVTVTARDANNNDITSSVIVGSSVQIEEETQRVYFAVQGGAVGLRAVIKVLVVCDDAVKNGGTPSQFVDYLIMQVREI